jgi:hypothetical protein
MDSSVLALSLAVVVVLILVVSCSSHCNEYFKSGKKVVCREEDGSSNLVLNPPPLAVSPLANASEGDNTGQYWSDTGSGLMNQQLASQYSDLQNLKGYGAWGEVAQYQALEPEVYESHEEYTDDMNRVSSGASMMTIRSDPNDVNMWRGLRRPDYHSIYAASDARVDHTEVPDQMQSQTRYLV